MPTPSVRSWVRASLEDGSLDATSPLLLVKGIGPYLEARAARAFRKPLPLTVGDVWEATGERRDAKEVVRRIVQNERANQCVSSRVVGEEGRRRAYHAGDLNEKGYEAFAALLNLRPASEGPPSYAPLPHTLPRRPLSSKSCGCKRGRGECLSSSLCAWKEGLCVPSSHNARGFEGVLTPSTNQSVPQRDVASNRGASRTRVTNAHRSDPDTQRDLRRRHSRTLRYVRRGSRRWRRPGRRVREPIL